MEKNLEKSIAINGFGPIAKALLFSYLENGISSGKITLINTGDKSVEKKPELNNFRELEVALKNYTLYPYLSSKLQDIELGSEGEKGSTKYYSIKLDYANSTHKIRIINVRNIKEQDRIFSNFNIDIVVDASGNYNTPEKAMSIKENEEKVKRIVVTSPLKIESKDSWELPEYSIEMVYGVNHNNYNPKEHKVISASSCTTNAAAPLVSIILEELGNRVKGVLIETVHSTTNSQKHDDSIPRTRNPLKYGRYFSSQNIIPTTTGAVSSLKRVLPDKLKNTNLIKEDKFIDGGAVRVPTQFGSYLNLTFSINGYMSKEEINNMLERIIKEYNQKPKLEGGKIGFDSSILFPASILGTDYVSVINPEFTKSVHGMFRISAFYDNIFGYVKQVKRVLEYIIRIENQN